MRAGHGDGVPLQPWGCRPGPVLVTTSQGRLSWHSRWQLRRCSASSPMPRLRPLGLRVREESPGSGVSAAKRGADLGSCTCCPGPAGPSSSGRCLSVPSVSLGSPTAHPGEGYRLRHWTSAGLSCSACDVNGPLGPLWILVLYPLFGKGCETLPRSLVQVPVLPVGGPACPHTVPAWLSTDPACAKEAPGFEAGAAPPTAAGTARLWLVSLLWH